MEELRVYALVIGNTKTDKRYVAFCPYNEDSLAVYSTKSCAKVAKSELLKTCGHKDVYIKEFVMNN